MKLKYKGFKGTVKFSKPDNCYYGKAKRMKDIISYEGNTLDELEEGFLDAVDFYLNMKNME